MAGAGYKLFNTGDVLTAAQVNTYLQEQTVMVFASSTARTTALSGVLAEGMMSYLQDTNSVEVYNGTSWVNVGNAGDITEVQAGVGISIASGTGPIPVITNSSTDLITTAGDLLYGTAADTVARLGIGTAGQVLTVNSGATAPQWASPAGGGANWSLLNSGGTALTGAQTITVSGISGKDKIMVFIAGASSVNAESYILVRVNEDSGASAYAIFDTYHLGSATYSAGILESNFETATNGITVARLSSNASSVASGYVLLSGCNAAGTKVFNYAGAGRPSGGSGQEGRIGGGYYGNSSTISSISIRSTSGNLDAGTVYVYTSA